MLRLPFRWMSELTEAWNFMERARSKVSAMIRVIVAQSIAARLPGISGRPARVQRNTRLSIGQQRTSEKAARLRAK